MAASIVWKNKVIYQIFPRSFYDHNNDGSGDLRGIVDKLPYLKSLGISAIWLCPIYDTNFADAGYDVKNYQTVWPQFGTLDDFKTLVTAARKLGIEIIMDIVLNHVSDQHPWFKTAIADPSSHEHNYFIWRTKLTKGEQAAQSIFGGSAWAYVPSLKKYYFHLFAKEQVDLNWEHPDTIGAMAAIIDFWYKLGVRGFRLDAIKHVSKTFPRGNRNNHAWGPTAVAQLQKFKQVAFAKKPDAFILGEASAITAPQALQYGTGPSQVADNFFNFAWWWIGWGKDTGRNGYDPGWDYKQFVKKMLPFQNDPAIGPDLMTNFLSNHDTSRAISRWGDTNYFWQESAKTLAMMQFMVKGIPCIYYGEEIGMPNPVFPDQTAFRDVDARNAFDLLVDTKHYYTADELTKYLNINGRDNCRTPMQWNDTKHGGFNVSAQPWIKVGDSYQTVNVARQDGDPHSILNFYRTIIKMRSHRHYQPLLVDGQADIKLLPSGVIVITRTGANGHKLVALINITIQKRNAPVIKQGQLILSSWVDQKRFTGQLRSFEALMFLVKK